VLQNSPREPFIVNNKDFFACFNRHK